MSSSLLYHLTKILPDRTSASKIHPVFPSLVPGATMSSPSNFQGSKRPLPPPQSREAVLFQVEGAGTWIVIDDLEDLQICLPRKRTKVNHEAHVQVDTKLNLQRAIPGRCQGTLDLNHAREVVMAETPNNSPVQKKRLFVSAMHRRQVQEQNKFEEEEAAARKHRCGNVQDIGDTTGQSSSQFSTDVTSEGKMAEMTPENDQEEALRLAKMTHENASYLKDSDGPSPIPQTPVNIHKPSTNDLARERLEKAGHERSRVLREQALARKLCDSTISEMRSTSELDKPSDQEPALEKSTDDETLVRSLGSGFKQYAIPHVNAEALSNSRPTVSPDVDILFDIAQQAARDNGGPRSRKPKTLKKSEGSLTGPHPSSRAAADHYRTQSRHLTDNTQNLYSSLGNNQNIEECERRLRMLTSQTFPPSDSPKSVCLPNNIDNPGDVPASPSSSLQTTAIALDLQTAAKASSKVAQHTDNGDLQYAATPELPGTPLQVSDIGVPTATQGQKEPHTLPVTHILPPPSPEMHFSAHPQQDTQPTSIEAARARSESHGINSASKFPPLRPGTCVSISQQPGPQPPSKIVAGAQNESQGKTSAPRLSPLRSETRRPVPPQLIAQSASAISILNAFIDYPDKPAELTLPKSFHLYSEELQALVTECETQKERERDLQAIIPAMEQIARLGALDQFTDAERKEVRTVQDFVRATVDQGLSGKRMRRRVNDIRENMKRRISRCPPLDEPQHESLLDTLLPKERRDHINLLISEIQPKLERLRLLRAEANSKWYKAKREKHDNGKTRIATKIQKEKRVHFTSDLLKGPSDSFSHLPDGAEIELPGMGLPKRKTLTTTERKRKAQYEAADRRATLLRDKLALFEAPTEPEARGQNEELGDVARDVDQESVISEEEDGAEFFSAPPPSQILNKFQPLHNDIPLEEINRLENERQEDDKDPAQDHKSSQTRHDTLASSMQRKRQQQAVLGQQNTQRPDLNLLSANKEKAEAEAFLDTAEAEADPEFDDLDDDDSDDTAESSGKDHTCYRYVLKAQYAGMQDYEEEIEYIHDKCLNPNRAFDRLEAHAQALKDSYKQQLDPGELPSIHDTWQEDGTIMVRHIEFGCNARSSCNIQIEKEEYEPSEEAYKNAKIRRACNAKPIYTVYWEQTITPVVAIAGDEKPVTNVQPNKEEKNPNLPATGLCNSTEDADDDLFGPEPCEHDQQSALPSTNTAISPATTITKIDIDALRYFTNIAEANRHAKDVFMVWFMKHFRGRENCGYVSQEEYATEEQLKSYGNTAMWERDESFNVYTDAEVEGEEEGEEDVDAGGVGVRQGRRIIENDRFKVWVVRKAVKGPAN